jgi:hypothetical protein
MAYSKDTWDAIVEEIVSEFRMLQIAEDEAPASPALRAVCRVEDTTDGSAPACGSAPVTEVPEKVEEKAPRQDKADSDPNAAKATTNTGAEERA